MKDELKPCPFCGGKVKQTSGYMQLAFFKCINCGALVSFNTKECFHNPDKAVEAWNRRATNDKL